MEQKYSQNIKLSWLLDEMMAERRNDGLVHSPSLNLEVENFLDCMGTNVSREIILEINCGI